MNSQVVALRASTRRLYLSDQARRPGFINDLRPHCERRRVPFMAEDLARPTEFAAGAGPRPGARQAQGIAKALRAAAGDGKTVLVRVLCHSEDACRMRSTT